MQPLSRLSLSQITHSCAKEQPLSLEINREYAEVSIDKQKAHTGDTPMQLRFLGLSYASRAAATQTSALNVSGTYRGSHVSFSGAQPKDLYSAVALQYRGITYLR